MTFFDKFFTAKNRDNNKTEDEHKLTTEPFSSSAFQFNKEQIRVVLFRECDKRGRKLLFDSNAVEKLPKTSHIKSENSLLMKKSDQTQNVKSSDAGEVKNSQSYKFKKPSNDITLLGEMIFGSAAIIFKSGSTCKIHRLSSPKRVMFTNIIHAPEQGHDRTSSGHYFGSSSGSHSGVSCESSEETRTSSSDSKLYKQKQSSKHNVNTYPCIKQKYHHIKKSSHCEENKCGPDCDKGSSSQNSSTSQCSEKLSVSDEGEENPCSEKKKILEKGNGNYAGFSKYSELSLYCSDTIEKKFKCEPPGGNTQKDNDECKTDVVSDSSNLNNPLSSWKRRCMNSRFSSIEEITSEETDKPKFKTKAKLGMGLVVELSTDVEDELEEFLFNHSIILESILKKLQSSIETACIKRENFIDLTHSAFVNCQRSMYELITGEKYARAMWLSLIGKTKHQMKSQIQNTNVGQCEDSVTGDKTEDTLSKAKVKFLNDFCDMLAKFDTKDTNFFISTLLTAVLTHHLSWVTEIGESDVLLPQQKLRSALKNLRPYNPIWAQLNDLHGMLGSPLKCARTVITGSESNKNSIASIIHILTYFIRCYDVVETLYDFDLEIIANVNQKEEVKVQDSKNTDCGAASKYDSLSEVVKTKLNLGVEEESKNIDNTMKVQIFGSDIPVTEHIDENNLRPKNTFQTECKSQGMKKSKSCSFRLGKDDDMTVYPNVEHHAEMESIQILDKINKKECDTSNNHLTGNEPNKKISHEVEVPSKTELRHFEDCDTTATSSTVINEGKRDCAERTKLKDGVLFVLGENEELVNLRKVDATESKTTNLRKEQDSSIQVENLNQSESVNIISSSTKDSKNNKVLNDREDKAERSSTESSAILPGVKCEKVDDEESITSKFEELPMPKYSGKHGKRRLDVSSVFGSVNYSYNSEQIIQGVLEDKTKWENVLRKDLKLYAHDNVLDKNVTEALCIVGDMNSWEVSLISSSSFTMDKRGLSSIRIGMSKLVADMLESLVHIWKFNLPADFCLNHIERKLHEIYSKSKCVAELLNSTEVSSIEYLTSTLDITVNDVPLLLSVATTHSPHISSRYGLTYT